MSDPAAPRPAASSAIGIDAIALAVPDAYLDLRDLAVARGVPPGKYTDGLLVDEMSIAAPHEDTVALAARAARRALELGGVDTSTIGLCITGTETAVDHSKPLAAWLHRLLGLPSHCRTFETKHACFGGTAGVLAAVDWIASGAARGRKALVVCSDIARYGVGTAGEPTQGAGAVALVISAAPRLLEFEVGVSGSYSKDVDDFWRPLWSKDALVDGPVSVGCYLDALSGAYADWQRAVEHAAAAAAPDDANDDVTRRCYHVPYGKMAKKAHARLCELQGETDAKRVEERFEREVNASLRLSRRIGNIYTGSLWLALGSLLESDAAAIEGQRISLFSYGSGCTAEFFCARVAQGAAAAMQALSFSEPLAARRRLSIEDYEAIRQGDAHADAPAADRADDDALNTLPPLSFRGTAGHRRVYG